MNIIKKLNNYIFRLQRRAWQLIEDYKRSISWHILGGRKKYMSNYQKIIRQHKWVFIVGCNNSGTSILQRIFNQSGQVSTWKLEGQRYSKVLPRAMRRGYERVWMEYEKDLVMQSEPQPEQVARLLHDWIGSLEQPVKPIILEKTPANLLRMHWLQQAFPDSYFIGIIRNGYAVAEGVRRKSAKEIGRAAKHWNIANKRLLKESKSINRYIEIKYEDFFDSADSVCEKISNFVDLDVNMLREAMTRRYALRTIEGEGEQSLKNMNIGSIERMSKADIDQVYLNASEMLEHFRYDLDR